MKSDPRIETVLCYGVLRFPRQSLASSNKESSTEEERQRYNEEARKTSGSLKEVNVKKECKKIVSHLQEVVCTHVLKMWELCVCCVVYQCLCTSVE